MGEVISKHSGTEFRYIVGCRSAWVDDWRCCWDSRDPEFSNRTSRLGSAQQFKTSEEAEKSISRSTDGVYMVCITKRSSETIEIEGPLFPVPISPDLGEEPTEEAAEPEREPPLVGTWEHCDAIAYQGSPYIVWSDISYEATADHEVTLLSVRVKEVRTTAKVDCFDPMCPILNEAICKYYSDHFNLHRMDVIGRIQGRLQWRAE